MQTLPSNNVNRTGTFNATESDWLATSGGPTWFIYEKLTTWIAAVNANASNSGKQISVVHDPSVGSATYRGFVLKLDNDLTLPTSQQSIYTYHLFTNSGAASVAVGDTHTPSSSNDNYGTISCTTSGVTAATNASFKKPTGLEPCLLMVFTCEVDGEEFFYYFGNQLTITTNVGGFCIHKDTRGYWGAHYINSNNVFDGMNHSLNRLLSGSNTPGAARTKNQSVYDNDTPYNRTPGYFTVNATLEAPDNSRCTSNWYPANRFFWLEKNSLYHTSYNSIPFDDKRMYSISDKHQILANYVPNGYD